MPLDWLGQLKPTMQQQIALQRALLALTRKDEQKTPQLTLAHGLGGVQAPELSGKQERDTSTLAKSHFRPGAGSLEEALRAAEPSPGYISGEERSRLYKEKMYEKREMGAKEAYDRIITLDPEGQRTALDALRRYKREIYNAMETEGYLSPTGELVQPKQEATTVQYVTADNGEMMALTTYPDGRVETEHTGVYPMQEAEEGPDVSDIVSLEKLGISVAEFGERHLDRAIKTMGDMPRIGIDMVTDADGNEVIATAQHTSDWMQGVKMLAAYYRDLAGESPETEGVSEGEPTMDEVKSMYEGRPDLISDVQQKLGIPVTGVWDEATEFAFSTYGDILLKEKPPKEPAKKLTLEEQAAKVIEIGGAP